MRLRVQVVIEPDDDDQEPDGNRKATVVHEVATIERDRDLSVDTLGMQLAEAKDLLQRVQEVLIDEQVRECLAKEMACLQCRRRRAHKDTKTIVMRTVFGTVRLASPLWYHCACQSHSTRTFCPLAAALRTRNSRIAVSRKQVRRAGLLWTECHAAGRDASARSHAARVRGAAAHPVHG